jgi:ATP-dependent DNA helicase RecQ
VLRQLIALGHVRRGRVQHELTDSARAVLRGDVPLLLRVPAEAPPRSRRGGRKGAASGSGRSGPASRRRCRWTTTRSCASTR